MPPPGHDQMAVQDFSVPPNHPGPFMESENNNGDSSAPLCTTINNDITNSADPPLPYHIQSRPRTYTTADGLGLYHPAYPGDYYSEFQVVNNQQVSPTVDPMTPQPSFQMMNADFNRNIQPISFSQSASNTGPSYKSHHHQTSNTSTLSSVSQKSSNSVFAKQFSAGAAVAPLNENEYQRRSKPRIATTFWDDEKTVCYQVEAFGILVSRREDTNYVNGTKLLNVAGMTRGKRDGILKSEKTREVVKVGSMNLKGVWIPFERAAEIARNEGVIDALYPLFVQNLKSFFEEKGYSLRSEDVTTTKALEEVENKSEGQNFTSLGY